MFRKQRSWSRIAEERGRHGVRPENMNKRQQLRLRAARLLSDRDLFDSERERVLASYPSLNLHGLEQVRGRRRVAAADGRRARCRESDDTRTDLKVVRDALRAEGQHEGGIRNTLEYFVKGGLSLSYRLMGCGWARRIAGPAPPQRPGDELKHEAESYLQAMDERHEDSAWGAGSGRSISNGAFVCAALMAGLRMWLDQDSANPSFRLSKPWAVAGLRSDDYSHPYDKRMVKFWRWVVRQDAGDSYVKEFIVDTVAFLYSGADLQKLQNVAANCPESWEVYEQLWCKFELESYSGMTLPRLGAMAGQIQVPDDFDSMYADEIEKMFGGAT